MLTEQVELDPPPRRRAWWPWILIACGLGVVLLFWDSRPPTPSRAALSHPAVGKQVTKIELQPLTGGGEPVDIDDVLGKVTLINFWGTWCPPCRIEFPHLMELEQHFRKKEDFRFLSVSCSGGEGDDTDVAPSTAEFLTEQQADLPTYRDAWQATRISLAQEAGLFQFAYPTTVILDREARILGVWQGYSSGDELLMRETIVAALRKPSKSGK